MTNICELELCIAELNPRASYCVIEEKSKKYFCSNDCQKTYLDNKEQEGGDDE